MPHHIAKQVHDKFKIFSGELAADGSIGKLANEVAAFANKSKIAPKSIGVVYLEQGRRLMLTLGYRDDEEPYPVKLHSIPLGKIDAKAADFHSLEASMAKATSQHRNIICHELYVTNGHDFSDGPNDSRSFLASMDLAF